MDGNDKLSESTGHSVDPAFNSRLEGINRRSSDSTASVKAITGAETTSQARAATTTPSSPGATSSTVSVVSPTSQPSSNAQFLLTNPWLHTSLLYSQLYSQRLQSQYQSSAAIAAAANALSHHGPVDPLPNSSAVKIPPPSLKNSPVVKNAIESSASSGKKRSDVWRPY